MLLGLGIELPSLLPETLVALRHLLAFALELLPLDTLRQVYIEQPSLLACKLRQDIPQRLASGVQGLRHPCAQLSPLQCMADEGRVAKHTAAVLPDQVVQGVRRGIASTTTRTERCAERIGPTPTDVIMVPRVACATATRQPTLATTDQATQEILRGGGVSPCHLDVTIQTLLPDLERLLAADGRHRHGNPFLVWRWLDTLPRADWLER